MATRTPATSEDRDSEIRQRCGCKTMSSYAESCSAPSSRRHVEDVNSVGVAATHCATHETCTRNQQTKPRPLNHPIPQPNTQHNTRKIRKLTWQHVLPPPAKIATPRFGSDVAARANSSYAESCSAPSSRRHVEDVNSVGVAAARCARHETCTRNQQTKPRPLKHPIPQRAKHNTKDANMHGNTYSSHQRRSRLQDSAAMWLQDRIELR